MQKITENKIRCKKCGDVVESVNVHDFKYCSCGACAVDGGHDYLRRVGELSDWEEMSVVLDDNDVKTSVEVCHEEYGLE